MKHQSVAFEPGRLFRLAASCAAMALTTAAGAALAQTEPAPPPPPPPAPAAAPGVVQEVIVTGSRIKDTDAGSANPISVATAADIQKTEATTLEQFVRKMPAVDFTGGVTNNADDVGLGASQVSLRNLGPQRTLVLVNGQRYPFTDVGGTQAFDAVDLNNIPVPMIDHVDVLRDGASSVYGADAVAGVINIVTKQHFNGVEIGVSSGVSTYGDAIQYGVYSIMGSDFDKGNVLIEVGKDHNDPVLGGNRPDWGSSVFANVGFNAFPLVSSRVQGAAGVITHPDGSTTKWYFPSGLDSGVPNSQAWTLGAYQIYPGVWAGGKLPPEILAGDGTGALAPGAWNDTLPNSDLMGLDRRQINLTGNYAITPDITAVVEAFYTDRQSSEQLDATQIGATPTPAFPNGLFSAAFLPGAATCNVMNPTCGASPAEQAALNAKYDISGPENVPIYTRREEGGYRQFQDDVNTYRMRAALDGTVFNDYTWETGYFYGQSSSVYRVFGATNFYHMSQELGMNSCGTEINCSIGNFFGFNTLTPAQAQYMTYTATDTGATTQSEAYGNIGGPIWDLPAGKIKGVVGFEYRTDSLYNNPDPVTAAGDALAFETPTQGAYATASGYIEVNAPLLKDLPFVKMLTLDASGRYDYNTTFGRALTNKIGIDWAINDDFRFRGAHSTGFRAPQVTELYGGHFDEQPGGADPCAAGGAFANSAGVSTTAGCQASLTAVGLSPTTKIPQLSGQLNVIAGGNPNLRPETSQEWTMGGVFTPTFVPGLSVTADYYTVLVRDEIGTLDPNAILASCYGNVPYVLSQAAACAFVSPRDIHTGTLGLVSALNGNVFDENTDGIDLHVSYTTASADIGIPLSGALTFNGDANYLLSDNIFAGGNTTQQAGSYLNDSGWPRWKARVDFNYAQDNWSVDWATRYYGGVHNQDGTSACEFGSVTCPAVGALDFTGNETAGVFYHDISGTYTYNNINLTLGIDNLFDKNPPFLAPTGAPNTLGSGGYDFTGRFFYMKASVKF